MDLNNNYRIYNRMLVTTAAPHHSSVLPKEMLGKASGAWMLRYTTEFDCGYETQWWYLIKDTKSEMESLNSHNRKIIKNSLKKCYVKIINPQDYAADMYNIYNNAYSKYESADPPIKREIFFADCKNAALNNNIDVFGVFLRDSDILAGYMIVFVYDDCANYSSGKFDPKYLSYGVSHALLCEMNTYYLNIQNKKYVLQGERSIRHKTKVQDYCIKYFGFRKAYCKLNVVYKPAVGYAVRCLYPFRGIFKLLDRIAIFNNVYSILLQEDIRRSFDSNSPV